VSAARERVREALKAMQDDALSGNPANDTDELRAARQERTKNEGIAKLAARLTLRRR
jgi:hypothetical protein